MGRKGFLQARQENQPHEASREPDTGEEEEERWELRGQREGGREGGSRVYTCKHTSSLSDQTAEPKCTHCPRSAGLTD